VTVLLGSAELSLKALMSLSVGDVIELDTSLDSPLTVQVANKRQFLARVGKSGKRMGVQVVGAYDEHAEPHTSH